MRRILIVSPHFAPTNAPDMQRVRMSLPYYAKYGWAATVLAVHPDDVPGTREPELCQTYPGDTRIVRCRTIGFRWFRRLGAGTIGWSAWWPLFWAGIRLLRCERYDLVLFSSTQFLILPLGIFWRALFRVPYLIDLQDPWRTDYYERPGAPPPPGGWKYQIARLCALFGEAPSYRLASGFMSVSPQYLLDLRQRYPWFAKKPQQTILFGSSTSDLVRAQQRGVAPTAFAKEPPGSLRLVYTGVAGPIMRESLGALFAALRALRQRQPVVAHKLRFYFFGTSYAPAAFPVVQPLAQAYGVDDQVYEMPQRIGHLASLALLHQADVLILPGTNDPAYSPSKIYAYFLSQKPILGIARQGSQLAALLAQLGGAREVLTLEDESHGAASEQIAQYLAEVATGRMPAPTRPRNESWFAEHCLAENLTRRQCVLFEQCLTEGFSRTAH
jgi:hypothetical protein